MKRRLEDFKSQGHRPISGPGSGCKSTVSSHPSGSSNLTAPGVTASIAAYLPSSWPPAAFFIKKGR